MDAPDRFPKHVGHGEHPQLREDPVLRDRVFPQLKVLSVANMLGEAIWRIHEESSVSSMFR